MRILMVCLGNICRSPLAEGIFRAQVKGEGLDWEVASAGTGDWHVGHAPDRRGIAMAANYGYDISAQRARHFNAKMFEQFDHILVMDKNNLRDVLKLARNAEERHKVKLFLNNEKEVRDPYFDDDLFEPVLLEIEARSRALIADFKQ